MCMSGLLYRFLPTRRHCKLSDRLLTNIQKHTINIRIGTYYLCTFKYYNNYLYFTII